MIKLETEIEDVCYVISVVGDGCLYVDLGCYLVVNDIEIFDFPHWIGGSF